MTGTANTPRNVILNADCIDAMRSFDRGSVDFILTDPPYLVNYRDRNGRKVANDDNARWLRPAFNQMHRVLKDGGFAVSFYGWNKVDLFMEAWKAAGFRVVGIWSSASSMRHRRNSCAISMSKPICWRKAMFPCPKIPPRT